MTRRILPQNKRHGMTGVVICYDAFHAVTKIDDLTCGKELSALKGFIHVPEEAIACTVSALHAMQAAGYKYVDIFETTNGTHYRTEIQNYFEHGEKIYYGAKWGAQLKLTLSNFAQVRDLAYMANHSEAQTYGDGDGTHEVKTLVYKSRATVGAVWNGKQLSLFGGK